MAFTPEQRQKAIESNRRKAQERREAREHEAVAASTGIGESKRFGGDYRPPDVEARDARIRAYHVGGLPVGQLPEELIARLSYEHTDEGIAERNAGKSEHRVSMVRDEFTGGCQERADAIVERGMEPWEAPNPMQDVMDRHIKPGFRGRFLNPTTLDKKGMRGWEPVLDEHGQQVRVRDQILAQMPAEKADKRNAFYRDKSVEAIKDIKRQFAKQAPRDGSGSHAVVE